MEKKFDFKKLSQEIADQLRSGKPLTSKDGAFTPLIKQVLEAALEGVMDHHLEQSKKQAANRRNGPDPLMMRPWQRHCWTACFTNVS